MKKQRSHTPRIRSRTSRQAPPSPPVLRVSGLTFAYPGRSVLRGISLEAREGEAVAILGPNGSGKSTLLKIIATLALPEDGSVFLDRWDVAQHPGEARAHLGVVFQSPALDDKLTVLENLHFHGLLHGLAQPLLGDRIKESLEAFRLWDRRHERVEKLSGGLQRRVELAKGILHKPRLLLLDEPSTGLDPAARLEFWYFLRRILRSAPMCAILTTHLTDEADRCDRVLIMDRGEALAMGSPGELKGELGGDIVVLQSSDLQKLRRKVHRHFRLDGTLSNTELHLRVPGGAEVLPRLVRSFPELIESATLRKPSLEDVFLHRTGHRLHHESAEAARGDS